MELKNCWLGNSWRPKGPQVPGLASDVTRLTVKVGSVPYRSQEGPSLLLEKQPGGVIQVMVYFKSSQSTWYRY